MIEQFETYRPFMFALAYRMLGSAMEAEDVIQDAFLRVQKGGLEEVKNLKSYLATVVTRLCLNHIGSAKSQREQYLGPWLPEPIPTAEQDKVLTPTQHAERLDSISIAFLLLLETLSPAERAVFLLHDVFAYKHQEIGEMLGKSSAACRQLLRRARQHMADNRPRFDPDPAQHAQFLIHFVKVVEHGEIEQFLQLLAEDVVLVPDGGGERGAAIQIMKGREAVSAFILGTRRLASADLVYELMWLNGQLAIVARVGERPYFALFIEHQAGVIQQMHVIAGRKLANLS